MPVLCDTQQKKETRRAIVSLSPGVNSELRTSSLRVVKDSGSRREWLRLPRVWEPVHVIKVLIRLGIFAAGLFVHQASFMAAVVTELGTCDP